MTRGDFRADLYYRLNVVEIWVPPLRERPEEIPALAAAFLDRFNAQYGRRKEISAAVMARLVDHPWSGNVRELENVVRRLVVLDCDQVVQALGAGPNGSAPRPVAAESLREVARRGAREAERKALQDVLECVHWNRAEAARILKVSYKTLLNKVAECGLTPSERR